MAGAHIELNDLPYGRRRSSAGGAYVNMGDLAGPRGGGGGGMSFSRSAPAPAPTRPSSRGYDELSKAARFIGGETPAGWNPNTGRAWMSPNAMAPVEPGTPAPSAASAPSASPANYSAPTTSPSYRGYDELSKAARFIGGESPAAVNPLTHTGWMSPNAMAPVSPGTPPAPAAPGPERTPTYSGLTAQEKTGASFANFFTNLFTGPPSTPASTPATASITTTGLPGKMTLDPSAYSYSTPAPATVSITTTGLPYKPAFDPSAYSYAAPKTAAPTYGLDLKPTFSPRVEYNLQAKQATMGVQRGAAGAYGTEAAGSAAAMSTLFMGEDSMGEGIAEASAFDDYWYF